MSTNMSTNMPTEYNVTITTNCIRIKMVKSDIFFSTTLIYFMKSCNFLHRKYIGTNKFNFRHNRTYSGIKAVMFILGYV